ncbi:MAG: TPM domain-containing protein [Pseudomonadales bacterium]|nr:TPM domain-containing protein [Pseudomonadales bacterium]
MLSAAALERVRQAVEAAERNTDAEFVTVLAEAADGYWFIPTLWAAVIALLLPFALLLGPWWLSQWDVVFAQLLAFALLTALFRIGFLKRWLVPRAIKQARASNLAHRLFLELGVHRTAQGYGVLFFVSEAEHYVQLIADSGIDAQVDQAEWQRIVDRFTARVRDRQVEAGFLEAVAAVGDIMTRLAPATHSRDELPNRLVLL